MKEITIKLTDKEYYQSGHNSWVVGDEPAVIIDFAGVKEYVIGR